MWACLVSLQSPVLCDVDYFRSAFGFGHYQQLQADQNFFGLPDQNIHF